MESNTEKERTEFIDGDRETRIALDKEDIQRFFKELSKETTEANKDLDEITAFYYDLENFIRGHDVGTACFLKESETSEPGINHQLCFEDVPNPDVVGDYKYDYTFWRIGYCKIGNAWHLAAQRYKINSIEGPKPQHERLGDPIRLTHAPRGVRLQATHHIRDLLMLILENVKYNKNISRTALERVNPLVTSIRTYYDESVN